MSEANSPSCSKVLLVIEQHDSDLPLTENIIKTMLWVFINIYVFLILLRICKHEENLFKT